MFARVYAVKSFVQRVWIAVAAKQFYWILLRLPAQVASRTCCRWCCWWMTATSCDMELTAFKSAKGCELIATAFGWPSVPGISLLPPTESEARNIFPKGRSKLYVAKHFASVLQPVPSRATTYMGQTGSMLSLAALRLCLKEPLPFPLLKGWTRAGYHPCYREDSCNKNGFLHWFL